MKQFLGVAGACLIMAGCGETISSEDALRQHGYSETYVRGFHDGCASGKHAGGDFLSDRTRDDGAYGAAGDYKTGWDYAFVSCRDEEARELAIAGAIGAGIAAASSSHGSDGFDVREMTKGMDTSAIQAAGW